MKELKQKKCKACRELFTPFSSLSKACSPVCALRLVDLANEKKEQKQKDLESKMNKKALLDLNRQSLQWQHNKTQPVFNKLRRMQELKWFDDVGLEPVCISCQKPLGNDQWCNGHFKSVGANGRLRYDFRNSYLQHNRNCNMSKSGDINSYKEGLVKRFGDEGLSIIKYCEENNSPMKYTWQQLEEMRRDFSAQIRELERL